MCDITNIVLTGLRDVKIFVWSAVLEIANIFNSDKTFYIDEFKTKMDQKPYLVTQEDIYRLINVTNNISRHYDQKQSYNYTHCLLSSKYMSDLFENIFSTTLCMFMFDDTLSLILGKINKNSVGKICWNKSESERERENESKMDCDIKSENDVFSFLNALHNPQNNCIFKVQITCHCRTNWTNLTDRADPDDDDDDDNST